MNIPEGYQRIEGSERRIAPGALLIGPADPNETVSVTIIVRRRPDGPPMPDMDYWTKAPLGQRKFLSHDDFAVRHGAAQADLAAVSNFAGRHGLKLVETSVSRRAIVTSGTVGQMSIAFAVELGRYESPIEKYRGREGAIHIPADLANIVEGVFGLDNRRVGGHDADPANTRLLSPGEVASPNHYDFPGVDQNGVVAIGNGAGQTIGIFALEGGYQTMRDPNNPGAPPKPTDINTYLGRDITTNLTPVGTNNPGIGMSGDTEVMQDICIAASIAPGAQIAIYFAGNPPANDRANQAGWINTIGRMIHPNPGDPMPSVISISAHLVSGDDTDTIGLDGVSTSTIDQLHQYFQDAATLGITVFASSGDIGSSRDVNPPNVAMRAHVGYPASDPMVTSCGGTTIGTNVNGQSVEVTWNDKDMIDNRQLASGGGISYHFPLPSWQINPFVIDFIPPSINPDKHRGRGVPDVAGNASGNSGYPMTLTTFGSPMRFNARGTSAVAPLYAALMAVINANLSHNFGFLNPTLYYLGIARPFPPRPPFPFRDITEGNNQWQNNPLNPFFYSAGPGWDACTGWGTINGSVLLQGLKQLTHEHG